jgi:hypothetical protein
MLQLRWEDPPVGKIRIGLFTADLAFVHRKLRQFVFHTRCRVPLQAPPSPKPSRWDGLLTSTLLFARVCFHASSIGFPEPCDALF